MGEFAEKVRSIAAPRLKDSKRTTIVRDERDGSVAGRQVEHWDDRQDAIVTPKTAHLSLRRDG